MKRLVFACFALVTACAPSVADPPIPDQWRAMPIEVAPLNVEQTNVGRLIYRGGIEISSAESMFGGLSDLEVLDDNRVVAISDNGDWFEARLILDEAGALIGIENVRAAMMRDEAGRVFTSKDFGDSEDLTQLADGRFAVSFEQTQSIRIYDLNRDGPFGRAERGPPLADIAGLPDNAGLEALATASDGTLVAGAEGGERATTPLWRVAADSREPAPPRIGYPLHDAFSLTGLDRLPGGGFVALERFYAPVIGPRARITRFSEESLNARGEALPDVEELALLDPPFPLDNFEGISAVRMPNGVTRIYIVSDDNFNARQRTLLIAFDLVEEASAN